MGETTHPRAAATELMLEAINGLSGDMVFVYDDGFRVRLATGEVLQRSGWDPDAVIGLPLSSFVPAEQYSRVEGHLLATLAGRTSQLDIFATATDAIYAAELWPLRDEHGVITGGVAFLRDVTEQRRAESALTRPGAPTERERAMISTIRRGLAEDRLALHVQPIVDLSTREVTSLELLLRLIGDDGALLMPGDFLPTAEACGLITEIDRWVISRAGRLLEADPQLHLSVNISAHSLAHPGLPDHVADVLAGSAERARRLTLELTETAAVASNTLARLFIGRVRALGCRVSIDDFGSGFATFTSLRELPFDELKIDGALVRELTTNENDRVLVKAIADLATGLGKAAVAEFVEDEATARCLHDLGISFGQGYGLGMPRPLAADADARKAVA